MIERRDNKNSLTLLSIVAIVAIIGIVGIFGIIKNNYEVPSETKNLAGQAGNIFGATPPHMQYYGYYFVEDGWLGFHYLPEVKGVSNIAQIPYHPTKLNQTTSDTLKATGIKMNLYIDADANVLSNVAGARDAYLQQVKNKLTVQTDLIQSTVMISISEEWYTRLVQGQFDNWEPFKTLIAQGQTRRQQILVMKQLLEGFITDVKTVFPGIPTTIVENFWGNVYIPPANLDVLGIDAYFVPSSPACDTVQRDIFDNQVTSIFNNAINLFGKPIMMVGGALDGQGYYVMPSTCQFQWYYNLAQSTPSIMALQWFLYSDVPAAGLKGVRDPLFTTQKNFLFQLGQQFLSTLPPPPPPPPPIDQIPLGFLDLADCNIIGGWTFDPDAPSTAINVEVYEDGVKGVGTLVVSGSTNGLRPDVNSVYNISGNHGFTFVTPSSFKDGFSHQVYVYGISPNANGLDSLLTSSPQQIICPAVTSTNIGVTFTASSTSINRGDPVTLSWTTTKATAVTINQGVGPVPLSGSINATPRKTLSYTLTATNGNSVVRKSVKIRVR